TQESFQQDISTWLQVAGCRLQVESGVQSPESKVRSPKSKAPDAPRSTLHAPPLFYPAWEILPHEDRLPHSDVISDRLETLVALSKYETRNPQSAPIVITSVMALLQRTFPLDSLSSRTRTATRGDRLDPLDLVGWLEDQGYEPEAQVTQKG